MSRKPGDASSTAQWDADEDLVVAIASDLKELSRTPYGAFARDNIDVCAPNLLRVARRRRARQPGTDKTDAEIAQMLLVEALRALDPDLRAIADATVGIGIEGRTKSARRESLGSDLSRTTFGRRWEEALTSLAGQLARRDHDAGPTPSTDRAELLATDTGYAIEKLGAFYRLLPGRRVGMVTQQVTIRATKAMPIFAAHQEYFSDPDPKVLSAEALFGCRLIKESRKDGVYYALLEPTGPVNAGDERTFLYTIRCASTVAMKPTLFLTADTYIKALTMNVEFDPADLPVNLSRFADRTYNLRPGYAGAEPGETFRIAPIVSETWADGAQQGLCYGLAWDWSD